MIKKKITACVIAWNAEKSIVKMLNSIKDYCFQAVIVIDTRTTDNTEKVINDWVEYQSSFGPVMEINIEHFEWVNDSFSDARNHSLKFAKGDWIFWPDVDETMPEPVFPDYDVDFITVKCIEREKGVIKTVTHKPKLFKSGLGIEFRRSTHEDIWDSLEGKKGYRSGVMLEHEEKTPLELNAKIIWLLDRAKRELITEPWNFYLIGQIGNYYQSLEEWEESLKWLHRFMFVNVPDNVKAQAAIRIFKAYQMMDHTDCDNAMSYLYLSMQLCPMQLSAYWILYQIYTNDSKHEEALRFRDLILQVRENSNLPYDVAFESIKFN